MSAIILALHARYEAAWVEYEAIERATAARPAERFVMQLDEAKRFISEQTDTLQTAILQQRPDTNEELTVLAYHMWCASDRVAEGANLTAVERNALRHGTNAIFDFMVSEGWADMDTVGPVFRDGAMLAFRRRRFATGLIEDGDLA